MTLSISRGFLLPLFFTLWLWSAQAFAAVAQKAECPICGMHFSATAKTSYLTTHENKPLHLCSFSCAAKLSDRHASATFTAIDFSSGKKIPAESAYFLIRSKKLLTELEFDMPPSVVAFADAEVAKAKQQALGDGEVIRGWKSLKKTLGQ